MDGVGKSYGAITLARHGKPALSRKVMLSAAEYRDWWGRYEIGGLRDNQEAPSSLEALAQSAGAVIASTRRRSLETAGRLCGDREFESDSQFVEAPLPPPKLPGWLRMPPIVWGFIARTTWWFLDYHRGEESRREAEARSAAAADKLISLAAAGQDVLVIAHGFFNTMVARDLRRRGWRCVDDGGWNYWAARRFEKAP